MSMTERPRMGFWRQLLAALAREESDLEDDVAEPRQRLADAVERARVICGCGIGTQWECETGPAGCRRDQAHAEVAK